MKKLALILLMVTSSALGQVIHLSSMNPSSVTPRFVHQGSYVHITAVTSGVNNKGIHWTSSGGTLFNSNCTDNPCTVSIYSATTTGAISLTATSDSNPSISATTWLQFIASPVKPSAANVPQGLVSSANLSTLQARAATGTNVAFNAAKAIATSEYNSYVSGGWNFTCGAGSGVNFGYPDDYALYWISFMALMNDTSKNWGCAARVILLYDAVSLPTGALPFGGNVWSDESQWFILGIWWTRQSGALSPTDMNTVRAFGAWVGRTVNSYAYGVVVNYTGLNTSAQFTYPSQYQLQGQVAMGNNYIWSKILWNVGISLMVHDDTTDDPLLTGADNTCGAARGQICPDFTAGSLHSYWNLTVGSYLLRELAHLEDPTLVYHELSTYFPSGGFGSSVQCHWTNPVGSPAYYECFGDGVGGESAEGSWYSYSFLRLSQALNLIHWSGYDDPLLYGPQVALQDDSFIDMKVWADRLFITGSYTQATPTQAAYGFLSTGDTQTFVTQRVPYDMTFESDLLVTDIGSGGVGGNNRVDRRGALEWMTLDTAFGGKTGTGGGCTSHCGINSELQNFYGASNAIDIFLAESASDPSTISTTDPCSSFPTDWWTGAKSYNQHQEVKSGCTNNDSIFSTAWANVMINHAAQYQGGFDLWFNGGFITRRRMVFTDYLYGFYASGSQNMVQMYDTPGVTGGSLDACFSEYMGYYGGQSWQSYQRDLLINNLHSEMPNYTTMGGDESATYNGCWNGSIWQFSDVQQAYRDIIYLRNSNKVVWYDRATKGAAPSPILFLNTSGNGTVSGQTVSWTSISGGNKAKYTSLLPAGATVAAGKLIGTVQVTAPFSSLQNGNTMQAVCTATFMDGTSTNIASTLASWHSDTPSVATVSSTGLVTAVALGSAGIYCGAASTDNMVAIWDPIQPPPSYSAGFINVVSGSSSGTLSGTLNNNQTQDWENIGNIKVTPASGLDVRFLSVLDYGTSSYTPGTATLVQSSSGDAFDGALVGTSLLMFKHNIGALTGTTYPASGATTSYVTDLTPGATYPITGAGTPPSCVADNGGTCVFSMTGTGNITVGAGTPTVLPAIFRGGIHKGGVRR